MNNTDNTMANIISTPGQILEQTIGVVNNYYSTLEALGSKSLEYKVLYDKYIKLTVTDAEIVKEKMKEMIVKASRINELW